MRTTMLAALLTAALAPAAWAADTEDSAYSTQPGDPLATAKALILAKKFDAAVKQLEPLTQSQASNPDVHNLHGFSLRKTGRLAEAGEAYAVALELNPRHLGALEYQGELFLMLGEVDKAEANLAQISDQCFLGCAEKDDLAAAIAKWRAEQGS